MRMLIGALCLLFQIVEAGSVVSGINNAGFEVFRHIHAETSNVVISPLSLGTGLHSLFLGASGSSYSQLLNFLSPGTLEPHHQLQNISNNLLKSRDPTELFISNKIFHHHKSALQNDFHLLSGTFFNASIHPLENIETVIEQVNRQVAEGTNGKIKNLLSKDFINEETKLILVNILYFKAKWRNEFKRSYTQNKNFFLDAHQSVKVPTMQQTARLRYLDTAAFESVVLEFKGTTVEMVVYKPKNGTRQLIASILDSDKMDEYYKDMRYEQVELHLPKFHTENKHSLKSSLQFLGLHHLFDDKHADFSKIAASGLKELTLSEILQHTILATDEDGCEAAGATAQVIRLGRSAEMSQPIVLKVDVPFLYTLRDKNSGVVLFLGKHTHFEGTVMDRREL